MCSHDVLSSHTGPHVQAELAARWGEQAAPVKSQIRQLLLGTLGTEVVPALLLFTPIGSSFRLTWLEWTRPFFRYK